MLNLHDIRHGRYRLAAALAILLITAVAIPSPCQADEEAALSALRALDRRVLSIGWRLSESAAELCAPLARPGMGWSLHTLRQYRAGLRPIAGRVFALDFDQLGVLALAPGGPAAQAGIREDDVVIAFGSVSIMLEGEWHPEARAEYGAVESALARIESVATLSPISVQLLRDGRQLTVTVHPRLHCPWPIDVTTAQELAAAADGRRISISSGLAEFAQRDDDLAFIVAHELAHNLRRSAETRTRRGSRAREMEADRIGLVLAASAGYDTSGAGAFMIEVGRRVGPRLPWLDGHPPTAERAATLERLHLWIEAERRAGRPLRP